MKGTLTTSVLIKRLIIILVAVIVAGGIGTGVFIHYINNSTPSYTDSEDYSEDEQIDEDNEEDDSDSEEDAQQNAFVEKLCANEWLMMTDEVGDTAAKYTFYDDGNVDITYEYDMGDPDTYSSTYSVDGDDEVSFSYEPYETTIDMNLQNVDSDKLVKCEFTNSGDTHYGMFIESSSVNISDNFANELDGEVFYSEYFAENHMGQGMNINSDENGNFECYMPWGGEYGHGDTRLTVIGVTDEIVRLVDYGEGNGYLIFLEKCTDDNEEVNAYIFDDGEFITEQWTKQ